jgi:amidohydrolase
VTPADRVREVVDDRADQLLGLSHSIHADPEVGFEERRASRSAAAMLHDSGFAVTWGVAGLETAFVASVGTGPLHIALCCEYDALPGVGHACGHNIIASAAVGAGLALVPLVDELGITVDVVGTPAEEGGGGKIVMLDAGVFDPYHAALMVHPFPSDSLEPTVLAAQGFEIRYEGREAHAGAYPELGINAADAFVVAQTAIGLLRQHLRRTDRVHGIVTKGGDAQNVVPAHTTGRWMVRATTLDDLDDVRLRVMRCFEAGALATGATLEVEYLPRYGQMVHDPDLVAIYRAAAESLGRDFASDGGAGSFSTDMGNVSLAMPSIHPGIGIDAGGSSNHQPEFAAACASASADAAVLDGAKALALTAVGAATDARARGRLLALREERVAAAVDRAEAPI